jgi:'Cold-shock' DNA-binding domain
MNGTVKFYNATKGFGFVTPRGRWQGHLCACHGFVSGRHSLIE